MITTYWNNRLELLADKMLDIWEKEKRANRNPFSKICIVVNDSATENWLKQYYLLVRKTPQILMNLAFVKLPEFVNDWLEAQTRAIAPSARNASLHPYSKDVLTWRIYRILSQEQSNGPLSNLLEYVGTDPKNAARRRHSLAEQLAKLYDGYLNSRFQILLDWERNIASSGDWQSELYRKLVEEVPQTYADDYAAALSSDADPSRAFQNGFPNYLSIHIFDIPFMPEPTLRLLEKIAEAKPITFWTFNPLGNWLAETSSKKEVLRRLRENTARHRDALKTGASPQRCEIDFNSFYDSPEERLLGALASGARALIGAQCDDNYGDLESLNEEEPFATLIPIGERGDIQIHNCYSPRRELESIREGLHQFFHTHPDAKPHDAIILCADWETTAPLIEAVFNSDPASEEYIPVTVAENLPTETPLLRSFKDLLAFRNNRFESGAVFDLLGVPSIQRKFDLDEESVSNLRAMAEKANIRWGFDDGDVQRILGIKEAPQAPCPYTWQRGLDRMAVNFLYGPTEADQRLLHAGNIGTLLPCGEMEGEEAKSLASLWSFVHELNHLREMLQRPSASVQDWEEELQKVTERFYAEDEEDVKELKSIRSAIFNTARSAEFANLSTVEGDVFLQAVLDAINGTSPGLRTSADSVLFAPLRSSSATPHSLVWICGLNDGNFPRIDYGTSFDLIHKHPSIFDTTVREKDAFALLKAVLSARNQLSLSYVGKDIVTGKPIPPSVLLNDLIDYFQEKNFPVQEHSHPLHAYSPQYFRPGSPLPPSHSISNRAIAGTFAGEPQPTQPTQQPFSAFDRNPEGVTTIPVDDLADFFAAPSRFLYRNRLGLAKNYWKTANELDPIETTLSNELKAEIKFGYLDTQEKEENEATCMVETGYAPDASTALLDISALNQADDTRKYRERRLEFKRADSYATVEGLTIVNGYLRFLEEGELSSSEVSCTVDGHEYLLPFTYRHITFETKEGDLDHVFWYENANTIYPSTKIRAWIHHLAGHAAGFRFATVLFCGKDGPAKTIRPVSREEAQEKLADMIREAVSPLPEDFFQLEKVYSHEEDVYPQRDFLAFDTINTYAQRNH